MVGVVFTKPFGARGSDRRVGAYGLSQAKDEDVCVMSISVHKMHGVVRWGIERNKTSVDGFAEAHLITRSINERTPSALSIYSTSTLTHSCARVLVHCLACFLVLLTSTHGIHLHTLYDQHRSCLSQ